MLLSKIIKNLLFLKKNGKNASLASVTLYANGYGTIQDNKEAYAWVSVAFAQGFPGLPQKQVEGE